MGILVSLWGEKKTSMYLRKLTYYFELIMHFTKKMPSLVSLIASIVFNNSIGMEDFVYYICE